MSRLQERARPILIPLVEGRASELDAAAKSIIAAWAGMAIMAAEFLEKDKVAVSPEDRAYLMQYHRLPNNWKVWAAHYRRGSWRAYWYHNSLPVFSEEDTPEAGDGGILRPNTQTTTFVAGNLYIHAMSSSASGLVRLFRFIGTASDKLVQIWPPTDRVVIWPKDHLTDSEAHRISNAFFNWALRRSGYQAI